MSVTNDPNYHEGQPVFGPTEAVRPTGETGARCPWCGSEMRATMFAAKFIIGAQAKCTNSNCCARGPLVHDGSKEAALAAANARPLPDFPAGAPGLPVDLEYVEQMMFNSRSDNCEPELLYKYWPEIIKEVRWHRDRLTRTDAPARPAAAGLTLSDEEKTQCVRAAVQAAGEVCGPSSAINPLAYAAREAIAQVQRILSSRATGAEVEIAMPTLEERNDILESLACPCPGCGFDAGLSYARRHATMRTGGGE